MYFVIYVFFMHYIADFIVQTEYQALNKSKSFKALSMHVLTYTVTLFIMVLPIVYFFKGYAYGLDHNKIIATLLLSMIFAVYNGVFHFAVDFVTSKLVSYHFAKGDSRNAFKIIGWDQFLHITILYVSYVYFLNF